MARSPNPERREASASAAASATPAPVIARPRRSWNLARDLFLPTLLFAALGGMTWAVRGCSGFGAFKGCIFAGVTWGAAWWFIARDPKKEQSRRYASGWIVLALAFGIGIAGEQGWMQWPAFFDGQLNIRNGESVPISRTYGFVWLFLAGAPWAGIGACLLAWTGSLRETRVWQWVVRILLGCLVALLVDYLFLHYPRFFLPLYSTLNDKYDAILASTGGPQGEGIGKLVRDCRDTLCHLGFVVGFLLFELIRRDWKNAILIATVSVLNGVGWAACQNWSWAKHVWPDNTGHQFNFWRCWESSGGISIGIALGIAYFLVNRRMSDQEKAIVATRRSTTGPNFEWLLTFAGLAMFLFPFVAGETGGRRSIDFAFLKVPETANQWISGHFHGWSQIYFALALLIALVYYIVYRWSPVDGSAGRSSGAGGLANIAGGVFVVAAFIGLLFWQDKMILALRDPVRKISHPLADWALSSQNIRYYGVPRFYLIYLATVMALGLIWYGIRRKAIAEEQSVATPSDGDPNLERFGLYLGLLAGLGTSIVNGVKGWFNNYGTRDDQYWTKFFEGHFGLRGNENFWLGWLWHHLGPVFGLLMIAIGFSVVIRPQPRNLRGNVFPHAYGWIWLVLIVQNVIAQLITTSPNDFVEMIFGLYYMLLFFIEAAIIVHYQSLKSLPLK